MSLDRRGPQRRVRIIHGVTDSSARQWRQSDRIDASRPGEPRAGLCAETLLVAARTAGRTERAWQVPGASSHFVYRLLEGLSSTISHCSKEGGYEITQKKVVTDFQQAKKGRSASAAPFPSGAWSGRRKSGELEGAGGYGAVTRPAGTEA